MRRFELSKSFSSRGVAEAEELSEWPMATSAPYKPWVGVPDTIHRADSCKNSTTVTASVLELDEEFVLEEPDELEFVESVEELDELEDEPEVEEPDDEFELDVPDEVEFAGAAERGAEV